MGKQFIVPLLPAKGNNKRDGSLLVQKDDSVLVVRKALTGTLYIVAV